MLQTDSYNILLASPIEMVSVCAVCKQGMSLNGIAEINAMTHEGKLLYVQKRCHNRVSERVRSLEGAEDSDKEVQDNGFGNRICLSLLII